MEPFHTKPPLEEAPTPRFTGSIPEMYEASLGSFIFEPYARDIVTRIHDRNSNHVLELAAGTGCATRYLTDVFDTYSTAILATDISSDMIAVGRQQVSARNLQWLEVDITEIPFADNSFDIVICQFGMMFLCDKIRGFSEIRRVLRPDGQFLFNVWGPLEDNAFWRITNEVLMRFMGQLPPVLHKVGPFSSSYVPTVQQQLSDAGFDHSRVDTVKITTAFPSADSAAKGCIHGLPIKDFILRHHPDKIDAIERALAFSFAAQLGDFPMTTSFSAFVFSTFK